MPAGLPCPVLFHGSLILILSIVSLEVKSSILMLTKLAQFESFVCFSQTNGHGNTKSK